MDSKIPFMIDFSFFTGNITSIYLSQKLDTREYEIIPDKFLEPAFFGKL